MNVANLIFRALIVGVLLCIEAVGPFGSQRWAPGSSLLAADAVKENDVIDAINAINELRKTSSDVRIDVSALVKERIKTRSEKQLRIWAAEVTGQLVTATERGKVIIFIENKYLSQYGKNFVKNDELLMEYEVLGGDEMQITRAALATKIIK